MVKRVRLKRGKLRASRGGDSGGEVGYGKPPKHTQFKSGQSGNPKGRPKGSRNFKTELLEKLQSPVKITQNGRVKRVSTQRAGLEVLTAKAIHGDQRALEQLIRLAEKHSQPVISIDDALDPDDQDILDAYVKR
jgi:Family of unknown function (DUF5681)